MKQKKCLHDYKASSFDQKLTIYFGSDLQLKLKPYKSNKKYT